MICVIGSFHVPFLCLLTFGCGRGNHLLNVRGNHFLNGAWEPFMNPTMKQSRLKRSSRSSKRRDTKRESKLAPRAKAALTMEERVAKILAR